MEKQEQIQIAKMERSGPGGEESNPIHSTTVREFLAESLDSGQIKQEPEEGLSQCWEAQWQDFLKSLQPPPPGRRSPPTPSPPQAGDRAKRFLPSSKRAADASQWPGKETVDQTPLLDLSKGCEDTLSFVKIKEESLDGEEAAGVEKDRQRFRQYGYWEAEGPREALLQLQALCCRWLRPERCSKEAILDQLVLEQFLVILPEDMQSWVKGFRPETCAQAATLAEKFLLHLREAEKLQGKVVWPAEEDMAANSPKLEQAASEETNLQRSAEAEEVISGETSFMGNCQGYEHEEERFPFERHADIGISGLSLARLNGNFFQVCGLGETPRTEQSQEIYQENQSEIQVFLEQKHLEASPFSEGTHKAKRKKTSPNGGTILRRSFDFPGHQKKQTLCTCTYCGKICKNSSHMTIHERTHTGEKPYKCSECGKCFSTNCNLMKHTRIHTGEKPYKCSDCGWSFIEKASLVIHERTHTGEKPYKCLECGKCFSINCNLMKHMKVHTGEKPYKCSDCGRSFSEKASLVIHERIHTGEKPFECPICGKSFTTRTYFITHKRIHTGEKPHKCNECGQRFIHKSQLVFHIRTHTGEKPYECVECGKSFNQKGDLIIHGRTHTGEKPYKCNECRKSFTSSSTLRKHNERLHTGGKGQAGDGSHKCPYCPKTCITRFNLLIHERTHTEEKPFQCTECGKGFSRSSTLDNHKMTHMGGKPYQCSDCGERFSRNSNLVIHQSTHKVEKLYECLECSQSFSYEASLRRHRKIHSRETTT